MVTKEEVLARLGITEAARVTLGAELAQLRVAVEAFDGTAPGPTPDPSPGGVLSGDLNDWTVAGGAWAIAGGRLEARAVGANENGYLRYNTPLMSPDHQITIGSLTRVGGDTVRAGAFVRGNADHTDYYVGELHRSSGGTYRLVIGREGGGGAAELASTPVVGLPDLYNVQLKLEARGEVITLSLTDPVILIPYVFVTVVDPIIPADAEHTRVGLYGRMFSTVRNTWDNISAGDVT